MRHHSAFLAAIAVLLAPVAFAAAPAAAAGPEQGTWVKVELELQTNNGLDAELESSEDGTVTLELRRGGEIATYEVPGKATEGGLRARFGRLGLIDVDFTPTRTVSSTAPGEGCSGKPRTLREGVFGGTIEFSGEHDFVRIRGPRARGSMGVISQWRCPKLEAEAKGTRPRRKPGGRESATLSVFSRACSCYLAAGVHHRHGGGESIFIGSQSEVRENMRIFRSVVVHGPASAFDFDHAAGTATLHPPRPLRGSASFQSRPRQRGIWRSTIEVPLLGADPIDTGAPGFSAILSPEYQFD